jgi:hypothetical protein
MIVLAFMQQPMLHMCGKRESGVCQCLALCQGVAASTPLPLLHARPYSCIQILQYIYRIDRQGGCVSLTLELHWFAPTVTQAA